MSSASNSAQSLPARRSRLRARVAAAAFAFVVCATLWMPVRAQVADVPAQSPSRAAKAPAGAASPAPTSSTDTATGMRLRAARIRTGIATMERVQVQLDWPADAAQGRLRLRVGSLDAPGLGYRFRNVDWQCPLRRDGAGGWRCTGPLQGAPGEGGGLGAPLRLDLALGTAVTDLQLTQGAARFAVTRNAAAPDDTRIDLTQVPVQWAQALLSQAWADGRMRSGTLAGALRVHAPARGPLRVQGPLSLSGLALETPDGSIAAEGVNAKLALDYRSEGSAQGIALDGALNGGELLVGSGYVALPATPVAVSIAAEGTPAGWRLPRFAWNDGVALRAEGSALLAGDGSLQTLDLNLRSDDTAPLPKRYLSGWLGAFGIGDLTLDGGLDARLRLDAAGLRAFDARLSALAVRDGRGRFRFDGLDGDVRFSADTQVESALRWRSGELYGLGFGAANLPLRSGDGVVELRSPAAFPAVGGAFRFDRFQLRPREGEQGLQAGFGLSLEALDLGQLAQALGWPPFRGTLSGSIPDARYRDDKLVFEGGLEMRVFDGRIAVSSLEMERPFGVAPTLSADVALHDLDMLAVTEVFDFGSISGRLDGRIGALRLVDWTPTAFDAELHSTPRRGVRQRISQRAVQNISSVGDPSFITSLQGRLLGLFDDFGYRRIGISCRLRNEVCRMSGLEGDAVPAASAGAGGSGSDNGSFTIVQGAGVPRLHVVGYRRDVDWATLLERLSAIGSGELNPVVQ